MKSQTHSGWGLFPRIEAHTVSAHRASDLVHTHPDSSILIQGARRSYGDACLAEQIVSAQPLHHLLEFDAQRGLVRCEAGISLDRLLSFIVPRGFFLPVTPGTKFPTLGGCIAADVHGKNHHTDGSIAQFIEELELLLADGSPVCCSRTEHAELFWATLGGMGLTGAIYAATLRLKQTSSSYMRTRTIKTHNFDDLCEQFEQTQSRYTYSVAWVDSLASGSQLGRGSLMLGEHASASDVSATPPIKPHGSGGPSVPFYFPSATLNRGTMRLFNALVYHRQLRRQREAIVHYDPYFYPLDFLSHWNRIYGKRGFLQYQFAVPFDTGRSLMGDILQRIAQRGVASFLTVLKTLGAESGGLLSFPLPGYTLALDIPLRDPNIVAFLHEITEDVVRAGGRIYLAKDAMIRRTDFEAMYPRLDEFKRIKRACDPRNKFRSLQSDRLGIT